VPRSGSGAGVYLASDSVTHTDTDFELTPSALLWALIAVASMWLVGLVIVGIGFVLSSCLGAGCEAPAPVWVFVVFGALGLAVMLAAGPVAVRITRVTWAWSASLGGPAILGLIVLAVRP